MASSLSRAERFVLGGSLVVALGLVGGVAAFGTDDRPPDVPPTDEAGDTTTTTTTTASTTTTTAATTTTTRATTTTTRATTTTTAAPVVTCSDTIGDAGEFTIVNAHADTVQVFWIDFDCELQLYQTLEPGQTGFQGSALGHEWLAQIDSGDTVSEFRFFEFDETWFIE